VETVKYKLYYEYDLLCWSMSRLRYLATLYGISTTRYSDQMRLVARVLREQAKTGGRIPYRARLSEDDCAEQLVPVPTSPLPTLQALKGFSLGHNGLISPGAGRMGTWLHRIVVMRAATKDVATLVAKIGKLQAKLDAKKGQHGKSTKRRDTTENTAQAVQRTQKSR
jgi:hypothetical protein